MEKWIQKALELGFDYAGPCKIASLRPNQQMRDMCTPEQCAKYGTNWGCAEAVGSLDFCKENINRFEKAIIMQTVGQMEDPFDGETIADAAMAHRKSFLQLCDMIRKEHPGALCLGAGECSICEPCKYPEPCPHPDKAVNSMSAYGLFVTQVCQENDMDYYHGPNTITYTAVILYI